MIRDAHLSEDGTYRYWLHRSWGASWPKEYAERVDHVLDLLLEGGDVDCLGLTAGGQPRHPLYVKGSSEPVRLLK